MLLPQNRSKRNLLHKGTPMRKTGKVIAIVQARLGSTRLPMKSLLCLRDVPVIDWVTRRLAQAADCGDAGTGSPPGGLRKQKSQARV